MIHPGHPLMLSLSDVILEKHANLLLQGTVLVDPLDGGDQPWLLLLLTHEVKSGDGQVISKRLQFVRVAPDGSVSFAGWAPHLDLEPLRPEDRSLLTDTLNAPWLNANFEQLALALAAVTLVPEHYEEIATRRISHVDKTLNAVHERLTKEIDYWSERYFKLLEDKVAGKDVRLNLENVRRTINDLESRLNSRKKELQAMRHVISATPVVLSGALVIPTGLLVTVRGESVCSGVFFSADAKARARIEMIAMNAVRAAEEARGYKVIDVSAQKCGWDITSYPPAIDGKLAQARHIEVKGRVKGADTITVTRNEVIYALNQADKFVLAIVLVGQNDVIDGPYYVRTPFKDEPKWGIVSQEYKLKILLESADAFIPVKHCKTTTPGIL
jgi:hypothetical protein